MSDGCGCAIVHICSSSPFLLQLHNLWPPVLANWSAIPNLWPQSAISNSHSDTPWRPPMAQVTTCDPQAGQVRMIQDVWTEDFPAQILFGANISPPMLFGQTDLICPEHGFVTSLCDQDRKFNCLARFSQTDMNWKSFRTFRISPSYVTTIINEIIS